MSQHPAFTGIRSTIIGIITNAILALVKVTAGIMGNSYALVADAMESTSDVFTSFAVWTGLKISTRPRDAQYPYGYGKAEPLTASIVALVLIGTAIIIAGQSLREMIKPHHAPAFYTLIVLVLVILIKESLFRWVFRVGESVGSTAVKMDAWHHRSDAITSAAAFIGISIALIGGKGFESADSWAAMFASIVIAVNAFRLLRPAVAELMDTSPAPEIEKHVRDVAQSVDGVVALDKCFVRKVGFEFYVDLHVIVDGDITVRYGHEISHMVKDAIRRSNPRIADILIHIEPREVLEFQKQKKDISDMQQG